MKLMLRVIVVVASMTILLPHRANASADPDDKDKQIQALQEQVRKLEARLAQLEKQFAPLIARQTNEQDSQGRLKKQQALAQQRMRSDLQEHNRQELGEAEKLYQVANKNWRSDEAKQSLQQMVERFPDVNRTGCAVLYLGQMSEGDHRERLLKDAAEKYGDCFYGNGVQVGAYARFLLALYYKDKGEADKAKELFDEIRAKYPDAVDHRGNALVQQMPTATATP
jgi:TolA-binding protein